MALSVTNIAAHALDKHSKDIADAVIEHNLVSAWLKANGRMKVVDGGKTFHEKVMYDEVGGFGWMSKDSEIALQRNQTITDAEYNIRILAGPLKVYHFEKSQAQGESQVADMVETTIMSAKTTMSNLMGIAVFNDGSDDNALHGLRKLVPVASGATVGGIDSGTYTWWERQLGNDIGAFNTSQEGIIDTAALVALCAGNDHDWPDLLVGTSAIWSLFHAAGTNIARLVDTKVSSLGYRTLDFQGIPVGWDFNCPSGHLYALNSKYLFLRVLRGGEFVTSDWERVQGQLADYATMHVYCQLTTNNRKKLGVIESVA